MSPSKRLSFETLIACLPSVFTDSADRIPDLILIRDSVNGTVEETRLKWEEPARPNGLILTYQIEYRRVDSDKYKPVQECITAQKFVEQKKEYVLNLPPGNYSVKVLVPTPLPELFTFLNREGPELRTFGPGSWERPSFAPPFSDFSFFGKGKTAEFLNCLPT